VKKLLLIMAILAAAASGAFAFDPKSYPPAIAGDRVLLNLGVGIGSARYGKMSIPPLTATVDIPVALGGLPLSFGGIFGFTQSRWNYYGSDYLAYTVFVFGGRANYHLNFEVDKLDLYGGITLGWEIGSWSSNDNAADSWLRYYGDYSGFYWGAQAGARFFFTRAIGVFGELGLGLTYAKAGLAVKF
jgi:hypothetical protein